MCWTPPASLPFLANTNELVERQDRFLLRMREQNVDGVMHRPAAGSTAELLDRMRQWDMPCVQALRHVSARGKAIMPAPTMNWGSEQITEHLIRLGHKPRSHSSAGSGRIRR